MHGRHCSVMRQKRPREFCRVGAGIHVAVHVAKHQVRFTPSMCDVPHEMQHLRGICRAARSRASSVAGRNCGVGRQKLPVAQKV